MDKNIKIIKAAYILGILADSLWTAALFIPSLFSLLTNNSNFNPDFETRTIMGIAASLMLGWTLLLIWALLEPIERRFILILTVCPVILCLFVVTLISVLNGRMFSIWILTKILLIMILMTYSYFKASQLARKVEQTVRDSQNNPPVLPVRG